MCSRICALRLVGDMDVRNRTTESTDLVTRAVIAAGLSATVAEMKAVVLRTAYSNLWREAGDLSCGILTASGEIVAQGIGDIPIHLASMPTSLAGCLRHYPKDSLNPGDILFQNDPYQGNNHLPDFIMANPVFVNGKVIAFTAVRGHYVDIGGPTPGSYYTRATDIYGEGLRIPPVLLYRGGTIDADVLAIIGANVRNPSERFGDMRSQHAGCILAERRIIEYCEKYGAETIVETMEYILDTSERRARAAISEIANGEYRVTDYSDGDGFDPSLIAICATVTVRNDEILIDFEGSARQARGGVNAPLAVTLSAAYFAVKAVTEPHTESNSGSYRPITVNAPSGTIVNPVAPAPVVAGNHETAARIADAVLGALAKAVPERVCAAGTGSSSVLIVSGRRPISAGQAEDCNRIMYEVHGAGQGANIGTDGANARRTSIGNTGNTPTEILETTYPIFVENYGIARDGGGAGRHRGGCSITRTVRFTEDVTVTIAADRTKSQPYGLQGGMPGRSAAFTLVDVDGSETQLDARMAPMNIKAGTTLIFQTAGAGGYGSPIDRSVEEVQSDLDDGYISPQSAVDCYGVSLEVDESRPGVTTVARR